MDNVRICDSYINNNEIVIFVITGSLNLKSVIN
jgi:hypothetical protein